MTFLPTIPEEQAEGEVREIYELDRAAAGYLPNYTRAFSPRPDVYLQWKAMSRTLRQGMDPRHYELASVAAAARLRCSYCTLAHGQFALDDGFLDPDTLKAAITGDPADVLDEVGAAIMELAGQVAADATAVSQEHVDRLRGLGLGETDIFNIIAAASLRCFFAKMLDALGADPDPQYNAIEPGLREALTVGRPIAEEV